MNTFIANEEPQWIELGGGQRRKIRAYNENVMLVEVGFDTGAVGAAHSHPHTQISYVLDGEFTYTVEGVTRSMKKGDSIAVEGGKVIAASQAGKYKTLCQCIGLAMLMLPMWSLAPEGLGDTPMWMTVYYIITYALIYLALILCLYSGGEYLVNTFGGRKKPAGKTGKETK